MKAVDVDEVGLKGGDGLAEDFVILNFEGAQFAKAGDGLVLVDPVEEQATIHFRAALLVDHAVLGCQHVDGVSAEPQSIGLSLAAQIVGAGMVRGIKIGEDKNLHVKAG